jgi:hypothetical protein
MQFNIFLQNLSKKYVFNSDTISGGGRTHKQKPLEIFALHEDKTPLNLFTRLIKNKASTFLNDKFFLLQFIKRLATAA